jgi:hypothetical protein
MKPDDYERDVGPLTLAYHAQAWSDMEPHVATLTRLASGAHAVLELGVRGAVSTWAMLDGLPSDGKLTSIDIEDVVSDGTVPRRVREDPRWTFIHGDDTKPSIQARVQRADLVLIDTSHEYVHTLVELWWAFRLGAKVIALHDWDEVAGAARHFVDVAGRYSIEVEPSKWGLGVLRR